jgi:hypothetical protein
MYGVNIWRGNAMKWIIIYILLLIYGLSLMKAAGKKTPEVKNKKEDLNEK